jgi:sialate O-acetylesterase
MKKNYSAIQLILALLLGVMSQVRANVSLPAIFGNHMVLQQNAEVKMWGWAKTGEEVTVTCSWNQKPIKTKANNLAKWEVTVNTPKAGGPYSINIKGYNTVVIEDVMVGEVWLCSGQSNMEWSARAGIDNGEKEVAKANYPEIRFFSVRHRTADAPQLNLDGEWVVCTSETMKDFSAVGYFFGREIHNNLKVPVGLINSSWGGTPIEPWMDAEVIESNKDLAEAAKQRKDVPWGPVQAGKAYNAMIAPLMPFRLAGALWYQGESNVDRADLYPQFLTSLIQSWRKDWNNEFPFYYVQIAPWNYGQPFEGVLLRDAQRRTMDMVPNTGMVVVSDIGNIEDIHPTNKHDVGIRLSKWALNKTYGKKDIPFSGPLYKEMKVEGNKIRLFFDHTEGGLVSKGKELTHFEMAGSDQKFVKAKAKIEGNTVVVQAKEVKNPTAVRFAWSNTAEPNLFNKAGLPASSFRTDKAAL